MPISCSNQPIADCTLTLQLQWQLINKVYFTPIISSKNCTETLAQC